MNKVDIPVNACIDCPDCTLEHGGARYCGNKDAQNSGRIINRETLRTGFPIKCPRRFS